MDHANWPQLLGGDISYQDLAFRRKEDARDVPNSIKIGLKNGPRLPPGLSTGEHISLLIDRETLNYSMVPSFDDLPIPFRCVSTELISGKAYVFDKGSLSQAMRATMSIPGVFDPVRVGDKVFVDGGLVDNLPTDVVRNMGADVVIAIHLQISKTSAKVALALGLGTMVGWKRIVVTVGEKIGKNHLTYAQGAAAEITAMATIGAADGLGLPVSTTHVLSSGVAGTMMANHSGLQWATVRNLLLAWVLTLPAAMTLSGFLFFAFRQFVFRG